MLTIDTLSLRLPAGFEHRAERIGRLLGTMLGTMLGDALSGPGAPITLDRLALPPIAIAPGAGDTDIAAGIAASVVRRLTAARREGGR